MNRRVGSYRRPTKPPHEMNPLPRIVFSTMVGGRKFYMRETTGRLRGTGPEFPHEPLPYAPPPPSVPDIEHPVVAATIVTDCPAVNPEDGRVIVAAEVRTIMFPLSVEASV